jgi:3-isopropylmalate dehydrogenase
MLLEWRGRFDGNSKLEEAARAIETAVDSALDDKSFRTRDVGGEGTTASFAQRVCDAI